jgi:peptidoglycan hydrolase-like protein with peptidoglycan-binding domain
MLTVMRGLLLFILFWVAGSFAAFACNGLSPNTCSDKTLCYFSVEKPKGVYQWSTLDTWQPYVKEAKIRGLDCVSLRSGKVSPKDYSKAPTLPDQCTDETDTFFNNLESWQVEEVQRALTEESFDPNGVDGSVGPGTKRAIRAWQAYNGFDRTGFLTRFQFFKLLDSGGMVADLCNASVPQNVENDSDTQISQDNSGSSELDSGLTNTETAELSVSSSPTAKPSLFDLVLPSPNEEVVVQSSDSTAELLRRIAELEQQLTRSEDMVSQEQAKNNRLSKEIDRLSAHAPEHIADNMEGNHPTAERSVIQAINQALLKEIEYLEKDNSEKIEDLTNGPLWSKLILPRVKIVGKVLATGEEIEHSGTPALNDCRISFTAGDNADDMAAKIFENVRCLEYDFGEWENISSERTIYETGLATVPLQMKRPDEITTFSSFTTIMSAEELNEFDPADCYLSLTITTSDGKEISNDIYLVAGAKNGTESFSIDPQSASVFSGIKWEKAVATFATPEETGQECVIADGEPIEIIFKDDHIGGYAPKGLVDRSGALVFVNVPLKPVGDPSLVIFLDRNIGPKGNATYAFAEAVNEPQIAELQKEYFKAFLSGLERFLKERENKLDLQVFDASTDTDSLEKYRVLNTDVETENLLSARLMGQLSFDYDGGSGIQGKIEQISKLSGPNTYFLVFGSQGSNARFICDAADLTGKKAIIFDVWPIKILVEADGADPENLQNIGSRSFYKCGREGTSAIYGILESKYIEPSAISKFVAETLKTRLN